MFYETTQHHGLAYDPFKAIVAPRPIGWISSLDSSGNPNLSPYSFFNGLCDKPPIVMFSSGGMKDSAQNAAETGEFTVNFVSKALKDQMNISSGPWPRGHSEFSEAGLEMAEGTTVACPRVAAAPAALECKTLQFVQPTMLDGSKSPYILVIGQATGIYIDDSMITDGRFDLIKADPIMRAGYHDYVAMGDLFEMVRPNYQPPS
ncbi:MAG: flavin reductase family protein [Ahrensia sp.]|nr:flavin reductase family protein [Ahrensia sp.]